MSNTVLSFLLRITKKYHFDRQNYISGSTGDTRGEVAGEWLAQECNYNQNTANEAKYIGRAMHSMQDSSSHGNIGINHSWPAHDVAGHADNREYIWEDDSICSFVCSAKGMKNKLCK